MRERRRATSGRRDEPLRSTSHALCESLRLAIPRRGEARIEVREPFATQRDALARMHEATRQQVELLRAAFDLALHAAIERVRQRVDAPLERQSIRDGRRRGSRRRRRAKVRDEVRDGEVGLVAHARDHGHRRRSDGPRDALVVERLEILGAATAATDDQDIDLRATRRRRDRLRDALAGAVALHERRIDHDGDRRHAPAQRCQHVAQRRGLRRGHDADGSRQRRQRTLAIGIEQPSSPSRRFRRSNASNSEPRPARRTNSTFNWNSPRAS
jgi:hypothetical protein